MWLAFCQYFSNHLPLSFKEWYPCLPPIPLHHTLHLLLDSSAFPELYSALANYPPSTTKSYFTLLLFHHYHWWLWQLLIFRVIRSWFHGDQLSKPNNQLRLECHPSLLLLIITPGLILLWLNRFSLSIPILLEILFNIVCSKRERKGKTRTFRRRTNRWKRTELWDTNRPTGVNNRHYTDLINPTPKQFPLQLFFVFL